MPGFSPRHPPGNPVMGGGDSGLTLLPRCERKPGLAAPTRLPSDAGAAGHGRRHTRLALALLGAAALALAGPAAAQQPQAPSESTATPARINTGLVTIESDLQRADQVTGVVTATGNVRIVYPDQRLVATARQAQYFSKEGRVVLSGDVDIVQEGGNLMRAEQVVYLVNAERMTAMPPAGQQVYSRMTIQPQPRSAAVVGP